MFAIKRVFAAPPGKTSGFADLFSTLLRRSLFYRQNMLKVRSLSEAFSSTFLKINLPPALTILLLEALNDASLFNLFGVIKSTKVTYPDSSC
jgi:hypothetical protein